MKASALRPTKCRTHYSYVFLVVENGAGSVESTIREYCVRLIGNHNTPYLTQVKRKIPALKSLKCAARLEGFLQQLKKAGNWREIVTTLHRALNNRGNVDLSRELNFWQEEQG